MPARARGGRWCAADSLTLPDHWAKMPGKSNTLAQAHSRREGRFEPRAM